MRKFALAVISGIVFIGIHTLPFAAAAGPADVLGKECHKQLKLGDSGCACIVKRAEKLLNEQQLGLVTAMVTEDRAALAKFQATMTKEEFTGAANFVSQTPEICATQ